MGRVFRARDLIIERDVAIKVVLAAMNDKQTVRFQREGEVTGGLRHPGIVTIFGGGTTESGRAYLVLELIEGARGLDVAMRSDPERKLDLLIEVAQAVGHAHRHGVVHRDLKPENVLVDKSGHPRVCDFGLAWRTGVDRLTQTGQLLGTPLYMAPERFTFESALAPRTPTLDVWSLGVMLYEALTDRRPFGAAQTLPQYMAMIGNAPIESPRRIDPSISKELQAVCLKAMSREPSERYPDADAFAHALMAVRHTYSPRRPRQWGSFAAGLAVGVGALTLVFAVAWEPPDRTSERATPLASASAVESPAPVPIGSRAPEPKPADLLAEVVERAHVPTAFRSEVIDGFRRVRELAGDDSELVRRADVEELGYLFRRGRWEEVFRRAPRFEELEGPVAVEAALIHAMTLYELNRPEEAAAVLDVHYERIKGRERTANELAVGAWISALRRRPEEALARGGAALQLDPQHVVTHLAMISAYGNLLRLDIVEEMLVELRPRAGDHPLLYRFLFLLACHKQDRKLAAQYCEAMVAMMEPQPPAHEQIALALSYHNLKRFKDARAVTRRILEEEPDHFEGRLVESITMLVMGEKGLAETQLRGLYERSPKKFEQFMGSQVMSRALRLEARRMVGADPGD